MFAISPRNRALYSPGPGLAVIEMAYGRNEYRHEPQALRPAKRPAVKPSSPTVMVTDRHARRVLPTPRERRESVPTQSARTLALLAVLNERRAQALSDRKDG